MLTLAIAIAGGLAGARLGLPLPWMLGPVLAVGLAGLAGVKTDSSTFGRSAGQLLIGASVGLAFTPATISVIVAALPLMLAFAIAALINHRFKTGPVLACLIALPIGPVEADQFAARHGVPRAAAVLGQSVRLVLLVLTVPPTILWYDGVARGVPTSSVLAPALPEPQLVLVLAAAAFGAWLFGAVRLPNAIFLGSITLTAIVTGFGHSVASLPAGLIIAAQIALGVSLGVVIDRRSLQRARRLASIALLRAVVLIIGCGTIGIVAALATGGPVRTLLLAAMPGGLPEIALTAKLLGADVATVTAFHVLRIYLLFLIAPPLISIIAARTRRDE